MTGVRAKLSVSSEARPRFVKPWPVPYALKEAIEKDLDGLEGHGEITPVSHSEWVVPIVPVPSP